MKSQTSDFFLDFIQDNPALGELFEILAAHNDELNISTIQQLVDLRRITPTSTTEVMEESAQEIGINVTRDIMSFRSDVFKKIFDTLPEYSEVSGTRDWHKFVAILLGTNFESYRLYTNDYQSFVPTPLGTMIKDGGTWYKTTHVDLEVDAHLINSGLDLTITRESKADIVAALINVGMTETEAEEWHLNHIGFDPVNIDPYQKAARNVMFFQRTAQLFYQWAPIEEVLHGVYTTINVAAEIYCGAHTVVENVRRSYVGKPLVDQLQFIQPDFIHGGEEIAFGVNVIYSDGSAVTEEVYVEDHEMIESRNGNKVVFREPMAISTIDLTVTYNETSQNISVRLFPLGIEPDPDEIEIAVKTLYGNSSSQITVYGLYANGQKRDITASGSLIMESSLGSFNGSRLVLPYVPADTEITIGAKYQGIFDHTDHKDFVVKKSEMELIPVSISITTPDTVDQGTDVELRAFVTYNDETSRLVDPQYLTTSEHTSIVENMLRSDILRQDFLSSVAAQFTDNGTTVSTTKTIKFLAPVTKLADLSIVLPSVVQESDNVQPKAIALYVKAEATQDQIDNRDPAIVVEELEVQAEWSSSADLNAGVSNLVDLNRETGKFVAPTISDGYETFSINAGVAEGSTIKTFSKLFDIYSTIYVPRLLNLLSAGKLESGQSMNLPVTCEWNTKQIAYADVKVSAVFVPSPSAQAEAYKRTVELQEWAIKNGQDPTQFDPHNPDYTRWVTLTVSDSTQFIDDPFNDVKAKMKQLYFKGDLHGTAKLTLEYTYGDTTIKDTREIVLIPIRSLVSMVEIECYDVLYEKSRTFARLFATYEDGSQEYVQAANWSALWPGQDEEDYELIKFIPSTYSGMSVVEILEGKTPTSFAEFKDMEASKLPMLINIGSLTELQETFFDGAIVQVNKLEVDTMASLKARFYRTETYLPVTLRIPDPKSVNTILSARIDGSTNITANVQSESYALVCTYEMPGIVRNMDGSYGNIPKTTFDAEMTCDWFITDHYTLDITNDQRTLVPSSSPVAVIDMEGNLTPSQNADTAVRIRARYQCDGYSIERFLLVYITKANTYLLSMGITGQEDVWDVPERNSTLEYKNGQWYIPYGYRVSLNTGEEIVGNEGTWIIGDDTDVEAVSIDSPSGHLSVGGTQLSDGKIRIDCVFVKINPESAQDETIRASRVVNMKSTRTITEAELSAPAGSYIPNTKYQLLMSYVRRNGAKGTNVSPDASSVNFTWSIIKSSPGFNIDAKGVATFAPADDIQTVTVRCTLREQRTVIERDIDLTCLKVGYPQDLTVTGFANVRDDSKFQLKAMLGRSGTFNKDDVSALCLWQVTNDRGDTIDVQGVSVDQKGNVTIAGLLSDTKFGIRCTYIENKVRLTQIHYITAHSSYPYYGTAPYGISSLAQAELNLTARLRSNVGGTFVFSPRTNEYGYFMSPSRYGSAQFGAASDSQGQVNTAWKGMDGARWPVTGSDGKTGPLSLQKVYDNVTETLYLYRTNERAFGSAVMTVRYS